MDSYVVTRRIGGGAQGSVFEVTKKENGELYALKVICCVGEHQLNAALKEVKFLLALRHSNVVSYVDFFLRLDVKSLRDALGEHDETVGFRDIPNSVFSSVYPSKKALSDGLDGSGKHYSSSLPRSTVSSSIDQSAEVGVCFIMELCSNGDLQSAIHEMRDQYMEAGQHPVKEKTIIFWLSQISSALKYIHEEGVIHRDVKPLNLFFDALGNIKIGDFGVASIMGVGCQSAVGTPDYLAPERLLHEVYDEKVDIWGLGMIALEITTLNNLPINSRVLENPGVVETVVDMVTKMGFSHQLAALIKSMLQRHPSDRPSSAIVLEALRSFIAPVSILRGPVLRQQDSKCVSSSLCSVCEVEQSMLFCEDCQGFFCSLCDTVRHKHPSRKDHQRESRTFSSSYPATSCVNNEMEFFASTMLKSTLSTQFSPQKNSLTSSIVRVPDDYSSISAALEAATTSFISTISVSTGYICKESLILTQTMSSISIIGENPPPIINVDDHRAAIHLASGSGCLSNFVIHHSGKREIVSENSNSESENRRKPPRPTALRFSGGEWEINHCAITCREGSGMTVTAGKHSDGGAGSLSSSKLIVKGCTFTEIMSAGIIFSENTGGVVEGNSFQRCGYAALVLGSGAHPKVFQNSISHCSQMGIICENAEGAFEENEISHNENSGVLLKGIREASVFSKNIISGNRVGILAADSARSSLCDNKIVSSVKAGIAVSGKACPIVQQNTISCGEGVGVYVLDHGEGSFQGNHICDNANAGVLVNSKGYPQVVENRIANNLEGVWLLNEGSGSFCRNVFLANRNGSKVVEENCDAVWQDNFE